MLRATELGLSCFLLFTNLMHEGISWSFDLCLSPIANEMEHLCICLLAVWMSSFVNTVLVQVFCHFPTGLSSLFLVMICKHSFHVLNTRPVSGVI